MPAAGAAGDAAGSGSIAQPQASGQAPVSPPQGPIVAEPQDAAAMLFDDDVVRTYELRVEPADLATMAEDPSAEVYVPGTFVFEDEQLPVGVRYKGNGGAFRPPCSTNLGGPRTGKCSIKVSFNWADPQGRFKGVKKLNFHAMNRDPSMLRDRLGYGIYR